jgi:nucleoside-diphosphate-sugar epimerase
VLDGRTIAVTGATGFIGARIVEYLTLAGGASVRCLVRSYSRLNRLAELPQDKLTFHRADLLDEVALHGVFAGSDAVVHCAFGNDGTAEQQWRITVDGTHAVVKVARALNVARCVYLSTAAIQDPGSSLVFDEETPRLAAPPGSYEAAKAVAENLVLDLRPDAVVLRPTVVYGPWGRDWTMVPLRRLAAGVRLPSGADTGLSNAVFVDDVARAAVRACVSAASGPLIIASDEPVTWGRFYDAFRALLPAASVGTATEIEDWERSLYSSPGRARIDRARASLGYEPRVSFAAGMERVGAWARWYQRLSTSRHGGAGCPDGC